MQIMRQQYDITLQHLHYIKEQLPVGDYFTINGVHDGIVLHDIVTREPLQETETPQSVLAHPDLRRGIDYLHDRGRNRDITVQLLLAPHGSAEDFTRIYSNFGFLLETAPAVALEMTSVRADGETSSPLEVMPHLSEHQGRRAFQQAQLAWARSVGKMVLPCELALDDGSELSERFRYVWNNICTPTLQDTSLAPEVKNAAGIIAETVYQRNRQPTILARMGALLRTLHTQSMLPTVYMQLPLIIGNWHENDKHRLAAMGVPVNVYETAYTNATDDKQWQTFSKVFKKVTYTSRASLKDLGVVSPYF